MLVDSIHTVLGSFCTIEEDIGLEVAGLGSIDRGIRLVEDLAAADDVNLIGFEVDCDKDIAEVNESFNRCKFDVC